MSDERVTLTEGQQHATYERPQPAGQSEAIIQFFSFEHLPDHLKEISRPFAELAAWIVLGLPRSAERSVALRKLLEAKDAAVRAKVGKP